MSQGQMEVKNSIVDFTPYGPTYPVYPTYPSQPAPESGSLNPSLSYIQTYSQKQTIKSLNGVVLCETFKTNTVKKKERSGFATIDQKVTLAPLMVLVGNADVPTGFTVYVRAEACNAGWGKETFESEGMPPFIRVPVTEIIYIKGYETSPWNYTWAASNTMMDCAAK